MIDFNTNRAEGVLVVRLDSSPYVLSMRPDATAIGVRAYSELPTLWRWIKLWWSLRHVRGTQKDVQACFHVAEPGPLKHNPDRHSTAP